MRSGYRTLRPNATTNLAAPNGSKHFLTARVNRIHGSLFLGLRLQTKQRLDVAIGIALLYPIGASQLNRGLVLFHCQLHPNHTLNRVVCRNRTRARDLMCKQNPRLPNRNSCDMSGRLTSSRLSESVMSCCNAESGLLARTSSNFDEP